MTSSMLALLLMLSVAMAPVAHPAAANVAADQETKAAPAPQTVNVNTATVQQFEALPGVGPSLAQRIVSFREKNGAFKKLEDLMNIQGIGEKSFLKLRPYLTVGGQGDAKPARD